MESLLCAVRISNGQRHGKNQSFPERLVRIRIGRHEGRKAKAVASRVIHQKPAVSDFRPECIISLMKQIRHVERDIFDHLAVICPAGVQLMISCFVPVYGKYKLPKSAYLCGSILYRPAQHDILSCIKRMTRAVRDPVSQYVHPIAS